MWQLKYRFQSTAAAMEASPGGFGGLFGCSWRWKIQLGRKKIFRIKNGHMGVHGCAPICPFFTKKYFSTRLAFCMLRTAKKAAKGTRVCLRSSSSALATVIQLSTPHRGRFWRCLVSLCSGAVRCTQPTDPPQVVFYAQGWCFMPLPSIEPGRARMGNTVLISFSVVSGEPSD